MDMKITKLVTEIKWFNYKCSLYFSMVSSNEWEQILIFLNTICLTSFKNGTGYVTFFPSKANVGHFIQILIANLLFVFNQLLLINKKKSVESSTLGNSYWTTYS